MAHRQVKRDSKGRRTDRVGKREAKQMETLSARDHLEPAAIATRLGRDIRTVRGHLGLGQNDKRTTDERLLDVSLEGLRVVTSDATIRSRGGYRPTGQAGQPTQPVKVTAYSFRVNTNGRGAAEHVGGTLEFDSMERRICWVEGNVPYFNINEDDHAYLDVYGVILNPQNSPTTDIVMPTENGWKNLYPRTLTVPLEVSLRVTAANARRATTRFYIDPTQGCRPIAG
jgi:hypothetical protein